MELKNIKWRKEVGSERKKKNPTKIQLKTKSRNENKNKRLVSVRTGRVKSGVKGFESLILLSSQENTSRKNILHAVLTAAYIFCLYSLVPISDNCKIK